MFGFPDTDGTHPGAVFSVDSIEAVGVKLTTFDASAFNDGDLIYVGNETFAGQGSIHDYVRVRRGAGLTPTEGEVWNSATAGVQFERLHTPSAVYLQQSFWTLTNDNALGTAIIDNDGQGAFPVSMKEAGRRRAGDALGLTTVVTVQVPDMTAPARAELQACMLENWWASDANGRVVFEGIQPFDGPIFTGPVVSFTPANHGTQVGYLLEVTNLGTFVAAGGPRQVIVQLPDGSKSAVVQAVESANIVRVSEPRTGNAATYSVGAPTVFVAAETINVSSTPVLPIWPLMPDKVEKAGATLLSFSDFDAEDNRATWGDSAPMLVACLINGGRWIGGSSAASLVSVGLGGPLTLERFEATLYSCGFALTSGEVAVQSAAINDGTTLHVSGNLDTDTYRLIVDGSDVLFEDAADFSNFHVPDLGDDNQDACIVLRNGALFRVRGDWWGGGDGGSANNTCRLAVVENGCTLDVNEEGGGLTVRTEWPTDFLVRVNAAGLGILRTDVTFLIEPFGGGVVDVAIPRAAGDFTFTGAILTSNGGATASFMGNPGAGLAIANQAVANQYPTGRRVFRTLRVTKLSGTASVNVVVTLVIAGGTTPTGLTVTILAADAPGTQYVSFDTQYVTVGDPQSFDLKMTAALDAAPGTVKASATLES